MSSRWTVHGVCCAVILLSRFGVVNAFIQPLHAFVGSKIRHNAECSVRTRSPRSRSPWSLNAATPQQPLKSKSRGAKKQQQQQQPQPPLGTTTKKTVVAAVSKNPRAKKKRIVADEYSLEVSMLNHDLLSREQEYELAALWQESRQLQARIEVLVAQQQDPSQDDFTAPVAADESDFADYAQSGHNDNDMDETDTSSSSSSSGSWSLPTPEYRAIVAEYGWHPSAVPAKSTWLERLDQTSRSTQASTWLQYSEYDADLDNDGWQWTDRFASTTGSSSDSTTLNDPLVQSSWPSEWEFLSDDEIERSLALAGGRTHVSHILWRGARARDELVRSNLKLVASICKRWSRQSVTSQKTDRLVAVYNGGWDRPSLSEAIQEGVIGLIVAAERFNPQRGLRFSTYATYWITNAVRQCFQRATTGCLRLPVNYYDTKTRYKKLLRQYIQKDGVVPTMEIVARDMGLSERRLALSLRLTQPLLSTDGRLGPAGTLIRAGKAGGVTRTQDTISIADSLADERETHPEYLVELSLLRRNLEHAMATELEPLERDVLRLRLGLDDGVLRSCQEVSQVCGGRMSSGEIRTAEQHALRKLRSPVALATYKLLTFLDFADVDRETVKIR
jgi:RNA polymerase sigma factor (sigma-70 family)